MTRNLQSSWIRPVDPIVDYDFDEELREWGLPCEAKTLCDSSIGKAMATWMIGGELYSREKIVVLCAYHAADYCRRHGVEIPSKLRANTKEFPDDQAER